MIFVGAILTATARRGAARHGGDVPVLGGAGRRRGPPAVGRVQSALRPQQPRARRSSSPRTTTFRTSRRPRRWAPAGRPSRWSPPSCACRCARVRLRTRERRAARRGHCGRLPSHPHLPGFPDQLGDPGERFGVRGPVEAVDAERGGDVRRPRRPRARSRSAASYDQAGSSSVRSCGHLGRSSDSAPTRAAAAQLDVPPTSSASAPTTHRIRLARGDHRRSGPPVGRPMPSSLPPSPIPIRYADPEV